MDLEVAIKTEAIDDEIDNFSSVQIKQENETADTDSCGNFEIKAEPSVSWEGDNLYVDHQIKEEIVIGPEELYKECNGTDELADDPVKLDGVLNNSHNRHNTTPTTSVKQKCELTEKNIEASVANSNKKNTKKIKKKTDNDKNKKSKQEKENDTENKCLICFKTFTFSANLFRHIKQFHTNVLEKKYSCTKCDMTFSRSDYLIRHRLIKHSEGKEILYCKCGNKFFNKWSLTRHIKGYCALQSSKPLKLYCDDCGKSFCNKYRLTEHVKRHLNKKIKICICNYCEKHFSRRFEIERHMFQHLGISLHKYECEICDKKFTRNWSLKKHLISHSGKKPFSCQYCERPFGSKWGCLTHEKQCCLLPDNNNYDLVEIESLS